MYRLFVNNKGELQTLPITCDGKVIIHNKSWIKAIKLSMTGDWVNAKYKEMISDCVKN